MGYPAKAALLLSGRRWYGGAEIVADYSVHSESNPEHCLPGPPASPKLEMCNELAKQTFRARLVVRPEPFAEQYFPIAEPGGIDRRFEFGRERRSPRLPRNTQRTRVG